jgi:hypothetical protein
MNQLFCLTALTLTLAAGGVSAQTDHATQREKKVFCLQEAGDKKGDARASFMKECIVKPLSVQEKTKVCNANAAGTKGETRHKMINACLMK